MRDTPPVATAQTRSRMSREARREQLVGAAVPLVAERGFSEFSLEELAERARVTRNLLYHYFPRGRPDVAAAAADWAGSDLTDDWSLDEAVPLPVRLAANLSRLVEHALAPSDAWRIYRHCRTASDPDLLRTVARYRETIIASISQNHLGTHDPPPLVHLALQAYLGFAETALDEARESAAPREPVMRILQETLMSVVESARSAARGSNPSAVDGS